MAYEPTVWKNREVENPRNFRMINNPDGTITLIPEEGEVTEQGTPITATIMNKIENQLVAEDNNFTKHISYAQTTSTNTNPTPYIATVAGLTGYVEGVALSIKVDRQNTGAATININGLGAKSIIKGNGSAVSSGNLKANSIYTLRYNGTAFILQGEGGSGNALVANVLAGRTFTNDDGELVGTMANRTGIVTTGAYVATAGVGYTDVVPPSGFYDGASASRLRVADANFTHANIKSGVSVFGLAGTAGIKIGGTRSNRTLPSTNGQIVTLSYNAGFTIKAYMVIISFIEFGTYGVGSIGVLVDGTNAGTLTLGNLTHNLQNRFYVQNGSTISGTTLNASLTLYANYDGFVNGQNVSVEVICWGE